MNIRTAEPTDLELIHRLAVEIWWPTYHAILSEGQISFMLDKMYSVESLAKQVQEGLRFVIVEREGQPVGFMGFQKTNSPEGILRIEKLYVLPPEQGKGTGSALVAFAAGIARSEGAALLELNVNRANPAFFFYQKSGFTIYREEDIPYYQYFMNDYVMRKSVVW
ncbi:MAG TPA: GNAT family N-acetyltransferase [Sphingobacteriaceae bacterium]